MRRRLLTSISILALAGCATTDGAQSSDATTGTMTDMGSATGTSPTPAPATEPPVDPSVKAEPVVKTPAEPGTPKVPEKAKSAPTKEVAKRSADGIDDENPLPPTGPARKVFDAAVALGSKDPKAAEQKFLEAAAKTTFFYAAYFNAGEAAELRGDDSAAEKHYRSALKERPDYGVALTNLYFLLRRTGRAGAANQLVDSALAKNGRRSGPHLAAAMRAYTDGDAAKAKTEALAAIQMDERSVPAIRLMGRIFYDQGRFETAKFAAENALVLEPGNALLYLDLGHVLLALKEEKKAMAAFEKAALLRPELPEAQEQAGILFAKYGDGEKAIVAFEQTTKLRPKSAWAKLHLANGYRSGKKYKEAEAQYKAALVADPSLSAAYFNLALLYMDNPIDGYDKLTQMELAEKAFADFRVKGNSSGDLLAHLDEYEKVIKKRIKREKKKRKRKAEREAIKAEEKAAKGKAVKDKDGSGSENQNGTSPQDVNATGEKSGNQAASPTVKEGGGEK